jgi:putative membrane protein
MMYWGNGMGTWGMALMTLGALLFWGLVIAAIVALARYTGRGGPDSDSEPATPQQVLADRFARGEIDETEYTHRLLVLKSHSHS